MQLNIALDSDRRRDLKFFDADDNEILVTVYQKDGDSAPISVSNMQIMYGSGWGSGSIDVGTNFSGTFSNTPNNREKYSIQGYIGSNRTTVAYGYLIRQWNEFGPWGTPGIDRPYEPLFVRNSIVGGTAGSYFEGPGIDGGSA